MIYIKFKDPFYKQDVFSTKEDILKIKPTVVEAVGYLSFEDDTKVVISGTKVDATYRHNITIYKKAILERVEKESLEGVVTVSWKDNSMSKIGTCFTVADLEKYAKLRDMVDIGFLIDTNDEEIVYSMERLEDNGIKMYRDYSKIYTGYVVEIK